MDTSTYLSRLITIQKAPGAAKLGRGKKMSFQKRPDFESVFYDILQEIGKGMRYLHTRINNNTAQSLETASFLYALVELLNEKGLLSFEELDERKALVAERLVKKFVKSGLGIMYQESEEDKYAFSCEAQVDCQNRLPICKAICCKFPFALSRQDVEEGMIRWEFGRPYLIAHDEEGYCVHIDRNTCQCTIYDQRPVPCRGFNCQENEKWRVWQDYEQKILNTQLVAETNENVKNLYLIPHDQFKE